MKTGSGKGSIPWVQLTGMWQQVQQNQFFCIESQLHAVMAGNSFGAPSILHGPCEMTEGLTGILARGSTPGDPAAGFLNNQERLHVIKDYSILGLLNPAAYGPLGCPGGEEI